MFSLKAQIIGLVVAWLLVCSVALAITVAITGSPQWWFGVIVPTMGAAPHLLSLERSNPKRHL